MKLDIKYLKKCYHDAMIIQYRDELNKEGFNTEMEKVITYNNSNFQADLYAEKNGDKRIYEFKLIGKREYQKGNITRFKEFAKAIEAKPFVVYVKPPTEKKIIFDDLGDIMCNYFSNINFPSELDELSTHTNIEFIEIDEISSVTIEKSLITLIGTGTIYVKLLFGSIRDYELGDGFIDNGSIPLIFTVKLDTNCYDIKNIEYEIISSEMENE